MKRLKLNSKKLNYAIATIGLTAAITLSGQHAHAQRVQEKIGGGKYGSKHDVLVINNDFSNSDCGIRLQNNDNGYFIWQRQADNKLRISSGGDGHNGPMQNDLFQMDFTGNMGIRGELFNINNSTLIVSDNLKVKGALNLTGAITSTNNKVKINDALIVTGNISNDTGLLTIDDDLKVNNSLTVNNKLTINQTLLTKSTSSFNDKLSITAGGLDVTGAAIFNNNMQIKNGMEVTGPVTFNNNMTIAGEILANAVTLNVGSFPDYVFDDSYQLMQLHEVESFISQHKHLPGMPSEAEVLANGMDVSQVNLLLVEKVEELTLHTISQEKEIEALKIALAEVLQKLENR